MVLKVSCLFTFGYISKEFALLMQQGVCLEIFSCQNCHCCASILSELFFNDVNINHYFSQLGLGDKRKRSRPVLLSELSSKYVNSVVCGHYHTLAITLDHKLYAWGWGLHGQLGLPSNENQVTPQLVQFFKDHRVVQAAAGYAHSAVLTSRVSCVQYFISCTHV